MSRWHVSVQHAGSLADTKNLQWPHNTGPIMTYMAACEGTTCDKFNSSGAKWFKIDEAGQRGSGWVQADISMHLASFLSTTR